MTDQEKDRAWQRCRGWEGALFESGRELCGMQGRVAVRVMLFNDAVAIRVMCQFHGEMLPGAVRAEEPLERGTSVIKERRKNWRRIWVGAASGSFPVTQFFPSGGQRIGASASVLPMSIQGNFL